MFKSVPHKDKLKMSQLLHRLPEMPSAEPSPLSNQDSSSATPLVFSSKNIPTLSHLNKDFVANYGSLLPDSKQGLSEGQPSPQTKPF
jgi:hypothetical protein